MNVYLSIACIC